MRLLAAASGISFAESRAARVSAKNMMAIAGGFFGHCMLTDVIASAGDGGVKRGILSAGCLLGCGGLNWFC